MKSVLSSYTLSVAVFIPVSVLLLSNTLCIGAIIASFALVEPGTPPALIVALDFCFGFFSSFGVATASLAAAFFIPRQVPGRCAAIIHGIHRACVTLGALTILSTLLFRALKESDGQSVSQHEVSMPAS